MILVPAPRLTNIVLFTVDYISVLILWDAVVDMYEDLSAVQGRLQESLEIFDYVHMTDLGAKSQLSRELGAVNIARKMLTATVSLD